MVYNAQIPTRVENYGWHIWLDWKTHVKDEKLSQQLTIEEWRNRLQLTTEKNLGS